MSIEERFGNRLQFDYTRGSHTDGGDPTLSPLFNFAGMNTFNGKVKIVAEKFQHHSCVPAVALGGALRTNVPVSASALPIQVKRAATSI